MRILKYNPRKIYKNLDKLKPYYTEHFSEELVKKYQSCYLEKIGHQVVDRLGIIPHFLNVKVDPWPVVEEGWNRTFEELVFERCAELINLERPLNIMWSGGLDSTVMLFALLNIIDVHSFNVPIRVIANYNSVVESGPLFDKYIKGRVPYYLTTRGNRGEIYDSSINTPNCLFITGGLGDQLFGRNDAMDGLAPEEIWKPISLQSARTSILSLLGVLFESAIKSPRKIETYYDFFWFLSFNFAWQSVKHHHRFLIDPKHHHKIINFYETDEFQKWAIAFKEKPMLEDLSTYKWPARQLILKLTGEERYCREKPKEVSSHSYYGTDWLAMLEDGTMI